MPPSAWNMAMMFGENAVFFFTRLPMTFGEVGPQSPDLQATMDQIVMKGFHQTNQKKALFRSFSWLPLSNGKKIRPS